MSVLSLHHEPLQAAWLDAYGHLNEAYYLVPFSNATWKLQDHFGIGVEYYQQPGCALYTVETHLRYLREVRAPAELSIESMILGCTRKAIHFAHFMKVADSIRCSAEFMLLHYSTREEKTIELPDQARHRLMQSVVESPPEWIGSRITLRQ